MIGLKKSSGSEYGGEMALGFQKQKDESFMAMRSPGTFTIEFLLSACRSRSGGCGSDALDRRAIYEDPILREPKDGRLSRGSGPRDQPEASSKAHESDGHPRDLPRPKHQPAQAGTHHLSVSSSRSCHRTSQSGLECGYYLHPSDSRFCVSRGDPRLVFKIRPGLETFEQFGDGILYRGPRRSFEIGKSGYLQHGSRMPVHESGFYKTITRAGSPDQHGLERPGIRQHLYGTTLEERQIRGRLHPGVSDDERGLLRIEELLPVLQPRAVPSGARLSDTAGDAWDRPNGKEVIHIFTVIHRERKKEAKKERDSLRLVQH